jgi:hypothetical protein
MAWEMRSEIEMRGEKQVEERDRRGLVQMTSIFPKRVIFDAWGDGTVALALTSHDHRGI